MTKEIEPRVNKTFTTAIGNPASIRSTSDVSTDAALIAAQIDTPDMTGLRTLRAEDEPSGTALYAPSDAEAHDGAGGGFSSDDAYLPAAGGAADVSAAIGAEDVGDEVLSDGAAPAFDGSDGPQITP